MRNWIRNFKKFFFTEKQQVVREKYKKITFKKPDLQILKCPVTGDELVKGEIVKCDCGTSYSKVVVESGYITNCIDCKTYLCKKDYSNYEREDLIRELVHKSLRKQLITIQFPGYFIYNNICIGITDIGSVVYYLNAPWNSNVLQDLISDLQS